MTRSAQQNCKYGGMFKSMESVWSQIEMHSAFPLSRCVALEETLQFFKPSCVICETKTTSELVNSAWHTVSTD